MHTPAHEHLVPAGTPIVPLVDGMCRFETVLRAVEADINARGWDQPTELLLLQGAQGCITAQKPVRLNRALSYAYPPQLLRTLATAIERAGACTPIPMLDEWLGWLLTLECWTVTAAPGDADTKRDAAERRLHSRDDRGEARLSYLGTSDGTWLLLVRQRRAHQIPQLHPSLTPCNHVTVDPIAQAFHRLVEVCTRRAQGWP